MSCPSALLPRTTIRPRTTARTSTATACWRSTSCRRRAPARPPAGGHHRGAGRASCASPSSRATSKPRTTPSASGPRACPPCRSPPARLPPRRPHGARRAAPSSTSATSTCCSSRTSATWSARPSFDLGHHRNVTLLSVTEGDDKPAKYPVMFRAADLVLISKADLLDVLDDFDPAKAARHCANSPTRPPVLTLSARRRTACSLVRLAAREVLQARRRGGALRPGPSRMAPLHATRRLHQAADGVTGAMSHAARLAGAHPRAAAAGGCAS
jgi:hypothetical protein